MDNCEKIKKYLVSLNDMNLEAKINDDNIAKCFNFITSEASKLAVNGCAMIEDNIVFGWARHFFDEDMFNGEKWKTNDFNKQAVPKKEQKNIDDKLKKIEKKKAEKRRQQKVKVEEKGYEEVTIFDFIQAK